MNALILAAILNYPVSPTCQQWLDRMDRESRYAARLVWSPRKERHIKRVNQAADQVNTHCGQQDTPADAVAIAAPARG